MKIKDYSNLPKSVLKLEKKSLQNKIALYDYLIENCPGHVQMIYKLLNNYHKSTREVIKNINDILCQERKKIQPKFN